MIKRYDPVGYDGLSAMMQAHTEGDYVSFKEHEKDVAFLKQKILKLEAAETLYRRILSYSENDVHLEFDLSLPISPESVLDKIKLQDENSLMKAYNDGWTNGFNYCYERETKKWSDGNA